MATQFNELLDQRSTDDTPTGAVYVRVYQLLFDARETEYTARQYVITDGGLAVGSDYPEDGAAKLENVRVEDAAANGKVWKVTATWKTGATSVLSNPNPLARPPEVEWGMGTYSRRLDREQKTVSPKRFVSSAGELFDDQPEVDDGDLYIRYTRNEATLPLSKMIAAKHRVNNASFTIDGVTVPALYGKIEFISASKLTENGVTYYRISWVIKIREGAAGYESDGWRRRYLDVGRYEVIDSLGTWAPILDSDGAQVETPWPLDGEGLAKANATDAPAVLGPFSLYKEIDFSVFGFA